MSRTLRHTRNHQSKLCYFNLESKFPLVDYLLCYGLFWTLYPLQQEVQGTVKNL